MKKIIFLDIDGVLNNELFYTEKSQAERYKEVGLPSCNLDSRNIELLVDICKQTKASIVISSTWRKSERNLKGFEEFLKEHDKNGNTNIIGKTPNLGLGKDYRYTIPRGVEIDYWIKSNIPYGEQEDFRYVILDDDSDMLYQQKDHFFLVDGYCGITPNLAYKIINHLNRK